ncbi:MAG: FadR family transcriptional regulator [Chloroflexota bacterium]|nr:FadR family transcriptional regulator [Chloroflexota bacterium]
MAALQGDQLKRVVLSDVIADKLQHFILTNELSAGTSLPTEFELMKQYGVGRSAVREAAKVLVQRGLVDVRPGKGMTVSAPLGEAVTKQLITHLRMSQASPAQLFEVRELLETAIARSAAIHRTAPDLDDLHRILAEADVAPENAETYMQLDLGFHQGLARATKNPFYVLVVSAIFLLLRDPSLAPLRYSTNRKTTQAEHREILAALESGDSDEAAIAALRHLKRVRRSMEELLAERLSTAKAPVRKAAKGRPRPRRSPIRPARRT